MKNLEQHLLSLQGGNAAALNVIYAQTSGALFSVCLSILKNKQQAEDALHDAYIILMKGKSYKKGGNAFSYIYTVAKNCALKQLKKRLPLAGDELVNVPSKDKKSMEDDLFLKRLLDVLDEREREIVTLYAYAGLKHKEIAAALDIPEGTVRYTYSEAIKRLKKAAEVKDE